MAALALAALTFTACGGKPAGPAVPAGPASRHVRVRMREWGIALSVRKSPVGRVTFTVHNAGELDHEFMVLATTRPASRLPLKDRLVDEPAAGETIGEIEDVAPGHTRRLSVSLREGHYALICNKPGPPPHYVSGQRADFWAG